MGFKGGFSFLGKKYEALPFDIVGAYDFLQDAVDCYKLNVDDRIEQVDLTQIDVGKLPRTDILIGGFPCQDFSSSGPKTGFDGKRGKFIFACEQIEISISLLSLSSLASFKCGID